MAIEVWRRELKIRVKNVNIFIFLLCCATHTHTRRQARACGFAVFAVQFLTAKKIFHTLHSSYQAHKEYLTHHREEQKMSIAVIH